MKGWHQPSRRRRQADAEALSTGGFSFLPAERKHKTLVSLLMVVIIVVKWTMIFVVIDTGDPAFIPLRPAQMAWIVWRYTALCWTWTALQWWSCTHDCGTRHFQRFAKASWFKVLVVSLSPTACFVFRHQDYSSLNYLYIVVDATLSLINHPDNIGLKPERHSTQVKPHRSCQCCGYHCRSTTTYHPLPEHSYFKHVLLCPMNTQSSGKVDSFPREKGWIHCQSCLVDHLPDCHCAAPAVGYPRLLPVEGKSHHLVKELERRLWLSCGRVIDNDGANRVVSEYCGFLPCLSSDICFVVVLLISCQRGCIHLPLNNRPPHDADQTEGKRLL